MRVESVVLNGGFTDCCVLNAAFDASNRNYRVMVARDLVRGTDDNLEKAALAMVSLHLGLVAESSDILGEWRGRTRGRNAA
jgi:biuret amidohydrolase